MKKTALQFLMMIILFFVTLTAYAGDFKNVVVFGDSLSDNGNLFTINGGFPPAPYYEGRISNGPAWTDYLLESLGIHGLFFNYAYAGAQTGETNVNGDFPGFLTQTAAYVNLLESSRQFPSAFAMPEDTLFVIWIGNNDFLGEITDPPAAIGQAIGNIQSGMTELMEAGAINFLVVNLPDFGKAPRFNTDTYTSTQASQLAAAFNQALEQLLSGFETSNPALELTRVDSFTLLGETVENYETSGFTNAVDAQLDSEQGTVGEGTYIFWDDIHPTTKTHKLFADLMAQAITCESCRSNRTPYFEDGLTLTVPYIELEDNAYGFKLLPYANPNDEGLYWKFDSTTLTVDPN